MDKLESLNPSKWECKYFDRLSTSSNSAKIRCFSGSWLYQGKKRNPPGTSVWWEQTKLHWATLR